MALNSRPFHVDVPEAQFEDMRKRIFMTRWPEAETVTDWSQGVPLAYLREVVEYWADGYDWRRCETAINAFPQFLATIDGLDIHFVHVRSRNANAVPLILTHGWPGSILEFLKVIGPLTDPVAHGGDASDAFDIVCPSLPGYGFSAKPTTTGWGVPRIADAWATLMAGLGYERYGAQGGDWGAMVTSSLARRHPEDLIGIHLNMLIAVPTREQRESSTESERASLNAMSHFQRWETGYSKEQSTKPQTIGYGLVDSPVALAAWIIEKFHTWMDCGGDPESVAPRDELLDAVTIYWLTASGASSARLYWESLNDFSKEPIHVPTGCSIFPKEIYRPSRRWAEAHFSDLRYWNELERGGHFAALEVPSTFVDEVRASFRMVR
jgi:pimeloyl-ACP methyl ester carboxylesterase